MPSLLKGEPRIKVVAEAVSFTQAMELATKLRPRIVVLDLHMGDERAVTPPQVKTCLVGSVLMAMSIWNDDETKALADALGAVTFLDKRTSALS